MTPPAPDMAILVEWVIFSRPDWEADRLEGGVIAARNAQWPEARIAALLVRMVFDASATPWDLINAAREPQGTAACVPASREAIARYAAEARANLRPVRSQRLTGAALAAHQALESRLAAEKANRAAEPEAGAA